MPFTYIVYTLIGVGVRVVLHASRNTPKKGEEAEILQIVLIWPGIQSATS